MTGSIAWRADEAAERRADAAAAPDRLQAALVLIGVEAVDDVALAGARAERRQVLEAGVEGDQAERILEEDGRHADRGDRAGDGGGDRHAVRRRSASRARRSATASTVAVLGCSNSRTTSGEKLVSDDCAQSIDEKRSPACQSRRPRKSKPEPCERLRWSPIVTSRMRLRMTSSISVMSARLTSGAISSWSRVLMESAPAR